MILDLLTTEEVARLLRVQPTTVQEWRARNYGPKWTKVGKRCLYKRSDVEQWFRDLERLAEGARQSNLRQQS